MNMRQIQKAAEKATEAAAIPTCIVYDDSTANRWVRGPVTSDGYCGQPAAWEVQEDENPWDSICSRHVMGYRQHVDDYDFQFRLAEDYVLIIDED